MTLHTAQDIRTVAESGKAKNAARMILERRNMAHAFAAAEDTLLRILTVLAAVGPLPAGKLRANHLSGEQRLYAHAALTEARERGLIALDARQWSLTNAGASVTRALRSADA